MRPAGFQLTANERITSQFFDQFNIGDRLLADTRQLGAAATAVASIADQTSSYALRLDRAENNGKISSKNGVRTELLSQTLLRRNGARENHQAACFFVDPVNDAQTRRP